MKDRYPASGELCGFATSGALKRTALLFDRLYVGTEETGEEYRDIPAEITFGFRAADKQTIVALSEVQRTIDLDRQFTPEEFAGYMEALFARIFVRAYAKHGISVTPVYQLPQLFETAYPQGEVVVYQAAFESVPILDETKIEWRQILEIRNDSEALDKYRAFHRWLRTGIKADSVHKVIDEIGTKLEKYRWAIKKHGLKTTTGAIAGIVSVGLGTTLARFLAAPVGIELAMGALAVSGASVWLAERRIDRLDIDRGSDGEVAWALRSRAPY